MINPLIQTLRCRDELSAREEEELNAFLRNQREYAGGATIVSKGDCPSFSTLLVKGTIARTHTLRGGSRSISAIHIDGEFVDLHNLMSFPIDYDLTAMTTCTVALVPHALLRKTLDESPHLTRLLWLMTLIDAAVHRAWIKALGRQVPIAHLAHLICELYRRLEVQGLVKDDSFTIPLTQIDLADILGLSPVHVNRTMQSLRATRLMSWTGALVTVHDFRGLAKLAEFDDSYLCLQKQPR